jgi:hypothetical protein
VIDHLPLPGWTPWNAGPRGEDGPVDDVPPRSESCGLNLDIPSAFNQTMVEVRSQNEDGPGGWRIIYGRWEISRKVHRNLLGGNDILETAVGESYKRPW